jgi:hypothetical protein
MRVQGSAKKVAGANIIAGPNCPCGRIARPVAPALVNYLNPEPRYLSFYLLSNEE